MPPVAANPPMQPNGQTARNGQDRSLQTCRKWVPINRLFVGRGLDPSLLLCGKRNLSHKLCLFVNKTTIYTLPKNSTRNLSKNSKNRLTKYDNLW